jgi:diketogulonate reductase-like aldo/keto reductase
MSKTKYLLLLLIQFGSSVVCSLANDVQIKVPSFTQPMVPLSNGVLMPFLHFGTPSCPLTPGQCSNDTAKAVYLANQIGFLGIDTANHYHNQLGIREGLSKVTQKPWITSKIEACNNSYVRLSNCSHDTARIFDQNLDELGVEYVDLMLLHAPTSTKGGDSVYPGPYFNAPACNCSDPIACKAMQEQWSVMEKYYKLNKSKAIGVSNYCSACLDCIAATASITPHINQIEVHVGMGTDPGGIVSLCRSRGIAPQAYSPLGSGSASVLQSNVTVEIGKRHNVSSAQVALRYLLQLGIPAITSASYKDTDYMKEDLAIFNWTLTNDEMLMLSNVRLKPIESPVKTMCIM